MKAQFLQRGIAKAQVMRRWADRKGGKTSQPDGFDRSHPGTLACLVDDWLRRLATLRYSPRSVRTAQWAMRSFLKWARSLNLAAPEAVSRPLLEGWQHDLARLESTTGKPMLASTQRARLGYVQRFFGWLCRSGQLSANPAGDLELPRRQPRGLPKPLSLEEVEATLAVPEVSDALGVRDRAILEVLYVTGIRRRELAMLDVRDLNLLSCSLLVRHGKGNKSRVLPLGDRAAQWLRRYVQEVRPQLAAQETESALFLTGYGQRFSDAGLGNLVRRLMDLAGIRGTGGCHLFRHACATHMLERGADIRVIQQLLGHVRLETTAIYAEVSIQLLREVHARCHPFGGLVHEAS